MKLSPSRNNIDTAFRRKLGSRALQTGAVLTLALSAYAQGNSPQAQTQSYLVQAQFESSLRPALSAMGDRLERPGKERIIAVGTVSSGAAGTATAVQITIQEGKQLRIDYPGTPGQSVIFDGTATFKSNGAAGKAESDLVSSMIEDSMEQLFLGLGSGYAMRRLALAARLSDPNDRTITGLCDMYEVSYVERSQGKPQVIRKSYCVDSTTHLLRAAYSSDPQNPSTKLETRMENWFRSGDQMLPGKITRFENSQRLLVIVLTSATIGAKGADGLFNHP